MPITVTCTCGKQYQVANEHAGKSFTCKACNSRGRVPSSIAAALLSPAPPQPPELNRSRPQNGDKTLPVALQHPEHTAPTTQPRNSFHATKSEQHDSSGPTDQQANKGPSASGPWQERFASNATPRRCLLAIACLSVITGAVALALPRFRRSPSADALARVIQPIIRMRPHYEKEYGDYVKECWKTGRDLPLQRPIDIYNEEEARIVVDFSWEDVEKAPATAVDYSYVLPATISYKLIATSRPGGEFNQTWRLEFRHTDGEWLPKRLSHDFNGNGFLSPAESRIPDLIARYFEMIK